MILIYSNKFLARCSPSCMTWNQDSVAPGGLYYLQLNSLQNLFEMTHPNVDECLSVTVVAHLMALGSSVCHAPAPSGRVTFSGWSPSKLFCDPAYFCPAIGTPHPIAAPLLQQDHLATGTVESLSSGYPH